MKNKKGFTLIELLAVIVILAVVMLIGVTAVLPLIQKAQKNSLASEGLSLIDTGKTAYNAEQLATSDLHLAPTASYCFSLDWLRNHNYYDKASDKYSGSVLVFANPSGKYDYYFWITNGTYHISGGTADNYSVENGPGDDGIYKCGGLELSSNMIVYRANEIEADLYTTILTNGSFWMPRGLNESGYPISYFYADEQTCNARRGVIGFPECTQFSGNVTGIGSYTSEVNTVRSQSDIYLKHQTVNNVVTNSEVCLYYNSKELCIPSGYWQNNVETSANKLGSEMESTFESKPTCETGSDWVDCYYGDDSNYGFYIENNGYVEAYSSKGYCEIMANQVSYCRFESLKP